MPKVRPAASRKVSLTAARLEWSDRQGLLVPLEGDVPSILQRTGWIRTLGGSDVYIACLARQAGFSFSDMNAAVIRRDVQVLPSVRNCIYLVPRSDAFLALAVAEEQWRPRTTRELEKAGSDWKEVESAAAAALEVLKKGPQTPDGIRRALPKDAIRSLGDPGKKVGISSVLPIALRLLEFEHNIQRSLPNGRLDSEKYVWETTTGSVPDSGMRPAAERSVLLACRFFEFAAPATLAHFSEWAGISKKDAVSAVTDAGLVPIDIEGFEDTFFGFSEPIPLPAPSGRPVFLPFEDNLTALHGGPGLLSDPEHHAIPVPTWGSSKLSTLGQGAHMTARQVAIDGQVCGFWEFDPDSGSVFTRLFSRGEESDRVSAASRSLEHFLARVLSHGRSFTLDTDQTLRERVTFLRSMSR